MNFCWTPEPSNNFRETVEVGRYGVYNPDATIYYTSSGRGAFNIRDGGQILWEQKDGRDRRLTVFTRNGHTFDITRRKGGGYNMNTGGYWKNERGRIYF